MTPRRAGRPSRPKRDKADAKLPQPKMADLARRRDTSATAAQGLRAGSLVRT